jgi:hypothetical protein
MAVGRNSTSTGNFSTALGHAASTTHTNATAIGINSSGAGISAIALGDTAVASNTEAVAIGTDSTASASNSWAIGANVNNPVADSALLFDATMTIGLAGSLYKGATNDVWTNLNAPIVSSAYLHTQNAVSYAMAGEECVNGFIRNSYAAGVSTITWPSRTTITAFLENTVSGSPSGGTTTQHSSWKTTIINATAQTITLTAGTNQITAGTSLSAGIGANECVTFESYLTGTSYLTVRTSTQAI